MPLDQEDKPNQNYFSIIYINTPAFDKERASYIFSS